MLYSTSAVLAQLRHHDSLYFLKRQLLWAGFGLLGLWVMRSIPYSTQRRLAAPALLVTLVALILVLLPIFGKEVGGARRWLTLGPLSIQPSEFAKYTLLLYVARSLALNQERLNSFVHTYVPNMLVLGVMALLVFKEPDLGTAVVLAATASLQLLIAGVPWRYLACTALTGLPGLYWALTHVRFRMGRLMVFLNPWDDRQGGGYQAVQALLALGHGGLLGIGLGKSQQKLFYLPEAHTDFIFAVIGEELGLLGAVVLIVLFVMLLWRVLRIAVSCNDPFGTYLGLGIFVLLSLQIVMNLCVVIGLMPTKGLPLPFISLGGSNLMVSLMAIGTMLNIAEGGGRDPACSLAHCYCGWWYRWAPLSWHCGGQALCGSLPWYGRALCGTSRWSGRAPPAPRRFSVSNRDRAGSAGAITGGPGEGLGRPGSWHPPGATSPLACASAPGGRGGWLCHGASGAGRYPAARAPCAHGAESRPRADGAGLARFAQRVFISFPESAAYLPGRPVEYTGTPVREEICQVGAGRAQRG